MSSKPKKNTAQVTLLHNDQAIEVWTDNDTFTMTPDEADILIDKLIKAKKDLQKRGEPPGPRDLHGKDVGHPHTDAFAHVGRKPELPDENFEPYLDVGGYELDYDGAVILRDWLNKAISYLGEPKKNSKAKGKQLSASEEARA